MPETAAGCLVLIWSIMHYQRAADAGNADALFILAGTDGSGGGGARQGRASANEREDEDRAMEDEDGGGEVEGEDDEEELAM
eukprot:1032182-Rhodomonas_salina.1